jgi:hypothetical protein
MTAEEAARIFHDWAEKEGLLSDGPSAPATSREIEFALIGPITDGGRHILRSKQIQSLCFSEPSREILVFLKRAAPRTKAQLGRLPSRVDDVSIQYRQGQESPIGSLPPQPYGSPPYTVRQAHGKNALTCGSSISVGNWRDAGTLGCLVRDSNSVLYGLSNNQVSASCSYADVGLPIVAPGIADVVSGGLNPFTLGFHAHALPLVAGSLGNVDARANLDAAIFRIASPDMVSSFQGVAYDTPASAIGIVPGMKVEKVGRTTGHRIGTVMGPFYGVTPITYTMQLYGFAGVVCFDPAFSVIGQEDIFSDNEDSGSLVTHVDANGVRHAVGIVVGGRVDASAPGGKTSLILPIQPILAAFDVSLVQGHNV